jgi:hypothetical protein
MGGITRQIRAESLFRLAHTSRKSRTAPPKRVPCGISPWWRLVGFECIRQFDRLSRSFDRDVMLPMH